MKNSPTACASIESGAPSGSSNISRAMRDLAALATLPSIWVDCDVRHGAQNLADVLRAALRAFTVCVRIELPDGQSFDTTASEGLSIRNGQKGDAAELLDSVPPNSTGLVEISNGHGPLHALQQPIFFDGRQIGFITAFFRGGMVVSDSDRLLLHVAACQMMLLLQRHKDQEERLARKLAEERLRRAEQDYRHLIQLMPAAVYACDAEGKIIYYNRRAAELWGREPELHDDHQKFCAAYRCWFNGNVLEPEKTPMAVAVREGKSFRNLEPAFERPDGTRIPVLVNIDPVLDSNGKPAGAINVFQDVTALKNAEAELKRKSSQLAAFLETAAVGVHRVGPDGTILWANDAEMKMLGYAPEEYVGHHIAQFHADAPVIEDILTRLSSGEKICQREARLRCKDGSIKHVLIDSSVLWEDGRFIHTQCFTRDITDRKLAEESLRQRTHSLEIINRIGNTLAGELELEKLVQAVTDAGREVTGAEFGAFFYNVTNQQNESYMLYTLSGVPREAFSQFPMPRNTALFGPTFRGQGIIRLADVLQDPRYGKSAPHHGMPKGHLPVRSYLAAPVVSRSGEVLGGLFFGHSKPGVFTEEGEKIIEAIAAQAAVAIDNAKLYQEAQREITERTKAEEALRKRGERLQLLSETLGQLFSARDPDSLVRGLFSIVAAHLGVDTYLNYMVDASGAALKLHSCAGITDEDARVLERLEFGQAICGTVAQTGQSIQATDIQNSDDEKAQSVRAIGLQCYASNPLMADRQLLGTLAFASRTRTAFDADELQFLEIITQYTAIALERLHSAERLETAVADRTAQLCDTVAELEAFSYSVAHDMRAPLRAMNSYSRLLEEDFADSLPSGAKDFARRIANGAQRLDALITDVLNYSKIARGEMQLEKVDVESLTRETLDSYPNFQERGATILIQSSIPTVIGNKAALTQCISNILSNAIKFVAPDTIPRVLIRAEKTGGNVRLWFEDNGIGISEAGQKRIFGMFQRLNPAKDFEGTGIGLTIVRKAVERMGGRVGVESQLGAGSRFWIELKCAS